MITNFTGPFRLAREMSSILTDGLLENHPMGRQSLGCAWILGFAILRTIAEQVDFVFELFDPIDVSSKVGHSGMCSKSQKSNSRSSLQYHGWGNYRRSSRSQTNLLVSAGTCQVWMNLYRSLPPLKSCCHWIQHRVRTGTHRPFAPSQSSSLHNWKFPELTKRFNMSRGFAKPTQGNLKASCSWLVAPMCGRA